MALKRLGVLRRNTAFYYKGMQLVVVRQLPSATVVRPNDRRYTYRFSKDILVSVGFGAKIKTYGDRFSKSFNKGFRKVFRTQRRLW